LDLLFFARDQVTLFKSVGNALEDLCAARVVAERVALLKRRVRSAS
jgi:ornithine cyclodeaminase/alanine dehydrogenase-like protein (mu-crystallin family)